MISKKVYKIKRLIIEGKTASAIDTLQSLKVKYRLDSEEEKQIDLISSRYSQIISNSIKGVDTIEDERIEKNKINHSILELCDILKKNRAYTISPKPAIGILVFIITATYFILYASGF